MLNEVYQLHKDKLAEIAKLMGYALHVTGHQENERYLNVKLLAPDKTRADVSLDCITYGADKGRGTATALLPCDVWGYPVGSNMPVCSFSLERDARPLAAAITKITSSEAYDKALRQIEVRESNHEKRVSAGAELVAAMKANGIKFVEGNRNGDRPDHHGWRDIVYFVDDFGTIEVSYGGGYNVKVNCNPSAEQLTKGILAMI